MAAGALTFLNSNPGWADTSTQVPLSGEGGSFAEPIVNLLQNDPAAVSAISPFIPSYFDADVDQAQGDFAAGTADYAVSEFPLSAANAATAAANGRSFAYVPFAANPLAIAAIVECNQSSTLSLSTWCGNPLKLTVPLLAQIFTDLPPGAQPVGSPAGIGTWNDPQLIALNSGLTGVSSQSDRITPLEDVQPAASNLAMESAFVNNPVAKPIWDAYLNLYEGVTDDTPSDVWPHTNAIVSGGDQAITQVLVKFDETQSPPVPVLDPTKWGQGDIAYLPNDWLTGPLTVVPTAAIQNDAGAYVQPTVASMTASVQDATMDPTTNVVTFHPSTTDAAAYPIPLMSYLVVPTSGLDPAKATALAAFIKFVLSSTGQNEVQSMGAAGVTPAMVTAGLKVADEVAAQASTGATTTTTTTTTPQSSTPTTAPGSTSPNSQSDGSGNGATDVSDSSPSLALTGGTPWPLLVGAASLVMVGSVARRRLRSRLLSGGTKT